MRRVLNQLLSIFLGALVMAAGASGAADDRPNILLLMAEDLSPRIGAFGDAVALTPNIDALAKQGTRYTRTFTTAGVCAPSRAAHITGMHQISWGGQHMRAGRNALYRAVPPPEVKAYPELLRAAGYYTFNTSKLDYQFSNTLPANTPLLGRFIGGGPFTIWDNDGATDTGWRQRAAGQPFFGMINMGETHESGIFPPLGNLPHSLTHFLMQLTRAGNDATGLPVTPEQVVVPPYYPDTPTVRADIARHYNNIYQMDRRVGRVLAALDADGLADNTIVIWTTDHGDGLPRSKREIYDSGILVPLVVRWPAAYRPADALPGGLDARLISFVDFAPTIMALAGVAAADYQQGVDFRYSRRQYIYAARDRVDEIADRQRAVRDQRFKYIRSWQPDVSGSEGVSYRENMPMMRELRALYATGKLNAAQSRWFEAPGAEQLFDLHADPHELHNLAAAPDFAAELQRLRNALDIWLAKTGDMSDIPEARMAELFWPDGTQPVTASPTATLTGSVVTLANASEHASIGYRVDDGDWQLYVAPLSLEAGRTLQAKAVRYGWQESQVISVGCGRYAAGGC